MRLPSLLCALVSVVSMPVLRAKEPVRFQHAMVVVQEPIAAGVGLDVLKSGGNAVDAAVAIGFALAVTHPYAGNLGGGGFLLVRMADGRTDFLDFRECAPGRATRDMYLDANGNPTKDSLSGWRASGVPGSVAGFDAAHKKLGTKSWDALLAPAVHLAGDGFPVTQNFIDLLQRAQDRLQRDPEAARIFFPGGHALTPGQVFRQTDLAATLARIQQHGAQDFYHGDIARQLAAAMSANGGLITLDDLAKYKAIERAPLEGDHNGYHIFTAPPPSAGGIGLLQILGMLEGTGYATDGPDSPKAVHYEAEAMRRYYADRAQYLGDPDFYTVPVKMLLDPKYLAWRRSTIDPEHATPSEMIGPGLPKSMNAGISRSEEWTEGSETTHYNVVDEKGNAVAVTYTLNNSYGNAIVAPGLGFLLNDEMDDFAAKPGAPNLFGLTGSDANAIEPGKRPVSSMTPTIVTKDGKLFLMAGAPGGSRITTAVTEVVADVLDFGMNPQAAVDLPRFHQQWKPDILYIALGFPDETARALTAMGYDVRIPERPNVEARVEAIAVRNGMLEGGTESSRHGKVAGY